MTTAAPHRATRLARRADLLALHARDPERYPALLESVATGTPQSRWSLVFAFPREARHAGDGDFLAALDADWRRNRVAHEAEALPFTGGWFLYLGYELAGEIEPRLQPVLPTQARPAATALRIGAAVLHDHANDATWLVAEEPGALECIEAMTRDIESAREWQASPVRVTEVREDEPQRYLAGIARTHAYIRAGDVFQVNLSRGWQARLEAPADAADVYAALRRANPAPFAGIARLACTTIISSSPERLVEARGGFAQTRPIAGTRPRGATPAEDAALAEELRRHPKERAEHVMLLDLERNDLGRVCDYGSIEVNERMSLESYAHVHHIVSNVRGRLRPGTSPGAVIRAVFPGGTITGCPKVRCMEIIAELEGEARGAYTGSMGYLDRDGRMDLNILIRTLELQERTLCWRAGAGIVADSEPERELAETRAKARGLLRALGVPEAGG